MKNMFGDERPPQPLVILKEHGGLVLLRDGKYEGQVMPNGWTGKSRYIDYPIGEPVAFNLHGKLSLTELEQIVTTWNKEYPK